jgi:hypothetical protein
MDPQKSFYSTVCFIAVVSLPADEASASLPRQPALASRIGFPAPPRRQPRPATDTSGSRNDAIATFAPEPS